MRRSTTTQTLQYQPQRTTFWQARCWTTQRGNQWQEIRHRWGIPSHQRTVPGHRGLGCPIHWWNRTPCRLHCQQCSRKQWCRKPANGRRVIRRKYRLLFSFLFVQLTNTTSRTITCGFFIVSRACWGERMEETLPFPVEPPYEVAITAGLDDRTC